jgi:hypothetical protein
MPVDPDSAGYASGMLTLLSAPKPFRGHIGVIQANAIKSWLRLSPPCEVLLFGNEEGIAEAAKRTEVRHVPQVARSRDGTPLLSDVFERGAALAGTDLLCYVNADIILLQDFARAVQRVREWKTRFLMVGRRVEVAVDHDLPYDQPGWTEQFCAFVRSTGEPRGPEWIDYFVFPRDLYRGLPPFTLGRAGFDNWLLWRARSHGVPVVDASEVVRAIHQRHDYSHHAAGQKGVWEGAEAQENQALMGGWHHCYTLADATHRLSVRGLRRNLSPQYVRRRCQFAVMGVLHRTLAVRDRLGLRRSGRPWAWLRRVLGSAPQDRSR